MSSHDTSLIERLNLLNTIGISLSTEKDTNRLLERILLGAKELTHADGGTLYLLNEQQALEMVIVRTDSLDYAMGGTTGIPIPFAPIPLYRTDGSPNEQMVVTNAVLYDNTINIADAYDTPDFDFSGTYQFDRQTGYHSQSFLTIPLKNHENDIIGVLQLINARSVDHSRIRAFEESDRQLAESLASQAAVALTNKQLIDGMKELFDALVKMIASTIDEKSAHTGNHCKKLPIITMLIAEAVNNSHTGAFADFTISEEELYQLETAAWLHDSGKLTTPDRVMEKSTKLEMPIDRIELIKSRIEITRRDQLIERLRQGLASQGSADIDTAAVEDDELDDMLRIIKRTNTGSELSSDADIAAIEAFARDHRVEIDGQSEAVISEDELHHLSIRKGTITQQEREIINNHIVVTNRMLESLPFPKHLRHVPEYAGCHHERVDGKGFPRGLTGAQMSIPARIMAIADIFEALTANDRPYKPPMPLSKAIAILTQMQASGHIDPDLFAVFMQQKIYLRYAREHLLPTQLDID